MVGVRSDVAGVCKQGFLQVALCNHTGGWSKSSTKRGLEI
jgi:hypothetical protein